MDKDIGPGFQWNPTKTSEVICLEQSYIANLEIKQWKYEQKGFRKLYAGHIKVSQKV